MSSDLAIIIKYLEPTLVNGVDYVIQDNSDGSGAFISTWTSESPTQPTQAAIDSARTAALAANLNEINLGLRQSNGPSDCKMSLALISQVNKMIADAVTTSTTEMQEVIDEIDAVNTAYPIT